MSRIKFRLILLAFLISPNISNAANGIDYYCATDADKQCYWCTAGGIDRGGYCGKNYAGCNGKEPILLNSGDTRSNLRPNATSQFDTLRCTTNGLCHTNCSWRTNVEYRYTDISGGFAQVEANNGGCMCNEWVRNGYVCGSGYYGTANETGSSGCTQCPSYTNTAGQTFYGNSEPGSNTFITNCYLDGENGPFSDSAGQYDITTDKCYYVNYIVVPGVPGGSIDITQ